MFALLTVLNCIRTVPVSEVSLKLILPPVAVLTAYKPLSLHLPANTVAFTAVPEPASTLPAGFPTAAIAVTVAKVLDPVAMSAFAPVILSV